MGMFTTACQVMRGISHANVTCPALSCPDSLYTLRTVYVHLRIELSVSQSLIGE
jgi:hypothetical protein